MSLKRFIIITFPQNPPPQKKKKTKKNKNKMVCTVYSVEARWKKCGKKKVFLIVISRILYYTVLA